jgi:uncharacterized protein YegP (UPF0339 family)
MDKVLIYKDAASEWRWHREAKNNRIVATGGEGYTNKDDAIETAKRVNQSVVVYVEGEYLTDWE